MNLTQIYHGRKYIKLYFNLRMESLRGRISSLMSFFFICGNEYLSPTLCNLFNKLFEISYFPESWTEGYIIPLHKKGSIIEAENCRGITLLSGLGKLFSRVINNRLSEWAEHYFILTEAQAGFRSNMSTVDNIFVLHSLISHMINQERNFIALS